MRIASANATDSTIETLRSRQEAVGNLQERVSAGRRVIKPSDDPAAMGRAERARTRIERIQIEQRALMNQRGSLAQAESALGEASTLLQDARELVVSAGNPALGAADRASIAARLVGVREQLLALANRSDSNGVALFGALGSAAAPFVDAGAVQYAGIPGQLQPGTVSVPHAMDGQRLWMEVPEGNGVFSATPAGGNTGGLWTDVGQVDDPAAVTGHSYQIVFSQSAGATTWSVNDVTAGTTVLSAQPYVPGQAIRFDGISLGAKGAPANGDRIDIAPSRRLDIFSMVQEAADAIKAGGSGLPGVLLRGAAQLDAGLNNLMAGRSQAGEWLNRADGIDSRQQDLSLHNEDARSQAEDMDMIRGISDQQAAQSGLEAALKSYAQVQRLSLFNYLG